MKFVVAVYGSKHVGMLLAHIYSIRFTHPSAEIEIYHQDVTTPLIDALRKSFNDIKLIQTSFDFLEDRRQRISSKTLMWAYAARRQTDGDEVCFLDVDTLVCRELNSMFETKDWDIVFTFKDEKYVLNSGVLLLRVGSGSRLFMDKWCEDTLAILDNRERFRQANDTRLPFGGADQMALYELLPYRKGETNYTCQIEGNVVRLRGVPCEILNETRSTPIRDYTKVVHYKGGWQPILLQGRDFSRNRPRKASWEMYTFYLETFRDALSLLNLRTNGTWQPRDWGLKVPSYVEQSIPWLRSAMYAYHYIVDRARRVVSLPVRAARFTNKRIKELSER